VLDAVGLSLNYACLIVSTIFLLYATRTYVFALIASQRRRARGREWRGRSANPEHPFVSVMIPVYNEPNVVDRILRACVELDYDNYEVIVVDDSTDETIEKLCVWAKHPRVKVIHRNHRTGWKGGALDEGLKQLNPKSEFILVFDADFIPPKDVIQRLLPNFTDERVGAVQGYQWHVLNADENWITRAVRTLTAATYSFDFVARDICGGFNQLGGSVMMIRRKVLEEVGGFGHSITEDWELTLRLYEHGYRIVYDETVKVPCECPSTLWRFIRQQCRWAEGHTRNFRRYFWRILRRKDLPLKTKLDFLLVGGIFLQSVLFILGEVLVATGMAIGALWQPILPLPVSIGLFFYMGAAYPLSMILGLLYEGALADRYILGTLILSYLIVPFLAWASLRGLLLNRGEFKRTYKTGKITRAISGLAGQVARH